MISMEQMDQVFAYLKSVDSGFSIIKQLKKEDLTNNPYWWDVNGKMVLPAVNGKVYKIWKNRDGLKAYCLAKYSKIHNCPIFNPVHIERLYPSIDTVITSEPLVKVNQAELVEQTLKGYCLSKGYDFEVFKSLQVCGYSFENSGFSPDGDLVLFDYISNTTAVYSGKIYLFDKAHELLFEEEYNENQ